MMSVDNASRTGLGPQLVAVIDMGTSSVRMAIAEIHEGGQIKMLESLLHPVSLGKDTFTKGHIDRSTTEECVRVLRSFRQVLDQYQVNQPHQIRAVATSAVREASNRQAFLDRLYIATGINVEVIEEAEVSRFTYLSVQSLFTRQSALAGADVFIVEVGGGSTELLALEAGQVAFSHTYRLGSLRLRQMLDDFSAPAEALGEIMENQIANTLKHIPSTIQPKKNPTMLILGGDARFAASSIVPDWDRESTAIFKRSGLEKLTAKVLKLSVDDLVRKYHLAFPDAETLGPSLLTYVRLAQNLKLDTICVASTSLREGVFLEMVKAKDSWSDEFSRQIIRSAIDLGRRYNFDEKHAEQIADLCKKLFVALQDEHRLPARHGLILTVAAYLHEIGLFISDRSHHKHSLYIILHSELFGLGSHDILLAALVARYHRRALPKPTHLYYADLGRDDRIVVSKLAAILRVADALESAHSQRIRKIKVSVTPRQVTISTKSVLDLSLEKMAMKRKAQMFEQVYGKTVVLRTTRTRS